MATTITSKPVTMLGRCKGCKCKARIVVERECKSYMGDYGRSMHKYTFKLGNGTTYRTDKGSVIYSTCLCGGEVKFIKLEGRVTVQVCGSKCMGSIGHMCECSCGGKNHGGSFGG